MKTNYLMASAVTLALAAAACTGGSSSSSSSSSGGTSSSSSSSSTGGSSSAAGSSSHASSAASGSGGTSASQASSAAQSSSAAATSSVSTASSAAGTSSSVGIGSSGGIGGCPQTNTTPASAIAFTVGTPLDFTVCRGSTSPGSNPFYFYKVSGSYVAGDLFRLFTTGLDGANALDVDVELGTTLSGDGLSIDPAGAGYCFSANATGSNEDCLATLSDVATDLYVSLEVLDIGTQTGTFTVERRLDP